MNFTKAARPVIMSQHGMVSSGHALASLAGVKILQEGGNAVDAVLAAAFVSAEVNPETCARGGDLCALGSMQKAGHVEALMEVPFPSPSSWSTAANDARTKWKIGYLADNNVPYEGR